MVETDRESTPPHKEQGSLDDEALQRLLREAFQNEENAPAVDVLEGDRIPAPESDGVGERAGTEGQSCPGLVSSAPGSNTCLPLSSCSGTSTGYSDEKHAVQNSSAGIPVALSIPSRDR